MASLSDYPRFTLGDELTAEQRAFFKKYGFLHFRPFASPAQVQAYLKATQDVQAQWLADSVEKVNGVPIKYGKDVDGSPIVQRFAYASQHKPRVARAAARPALQSPVPPA